MAFDVAIIGGGIIGSATAAYLAEAGQSVVLFEATELAAGASGRNSGVVQHPFDAQLVELHRESIGLYDELAAIEPRFRLPRTPAGLLLVGSHEGALAAAASAIDEQFPELAPEVLAPAAARTLEPALAEGLAAVRLATGYPVVPAAATQAFGRRAGRSGADLRVGAAARPWIEADRVRGVTLESGEAVAAGAVLVAAGPWSAALVNGWQLDPPIRRTWGVVASVRLRGAPRHVLEQHDIDPAGSTVPTAFSLVTAEAVTSVGSTFLSSEPNPDEWLPRVLDAGTAFVPSLAGAVLLGVRACARPVSLDGRPLIGRLPVEGLFVCAGHGPWGISTGPASARMIASAILSDSGRDAGLIPLALAANRHPWVT